MPAPPAYLDECVDHDLVSSLRSKGYQVTSALEQGRANLGDADDAQLDFATARGWVLISHNERDFRNLSREYLLRGRTHGGIIILPEYSPYDRFVIRAAMLLDWLGTMPNHRAGFFKWGHLQELLEQGFQLQGYDEDDVLLALAR